MADEITECPSDAPLLGANGGEAAVAASKLRPAARQTTRAQPSDFEASMAGWDRERQDQIVMEMAAGKAGRAPAPRGTIQFIGLRHPIVKDQSQGARAHNPPSLRSAMRPFFCCGSELSLASLMDNVDLSSSGPSHNNSRSAAAARVAVTGESESKQSLSDTEETDFCEEDDYGVVCGSGSSIQTVCGMGKAGGGGAVVRRVKSDKRKSKKHFWSMRFGKKGPGGGGGVPGGGVKLNDVKKSSVCGQCGSKKCVASQGAAGGCQAACHNKTHQPLTCHRRAFHNLAMGATGAGAGAVGGPDRRASVVGAFPISGTDELLAGERSLDRTATRGRASCDMSAFMDRIAQTPLSQLSSSQHGPLIYTEAPLYNPDPRIYNQDPRLYNNLDPRMYNPEADMIYNPDTTGRFLNNRNLPHFDSEPRFYNPETPMGGGFMTRGGVGSSSDDLAWVELGGQGMGVVHTRMDFIHYLVPDLSTITACSFYWGVIDRYEAERLLENKKEGTFLLRDSAQDDFLFSVSFRRYNRSLHARIEQWNHRFSFDIHDPAVYSADSVCGLIEHYKDSSRCMFFEPMLTEPMHRNFPFSLQHLARAAISNRLHRYDHIGRLPLPSAMKSYLKYYHYKQKVCIRSFEDPTE